MFRIVMAIARLVALWRELGVAAPDGPPIVADGTPVIREVRCEPDVTSIVLTFAGSGPGDGPGSSQRTEAELPAWCVSLGTSPPTTVGSEGFLAFEEPDAVYFLKAIGGRFRLDTATAQTFSGWLAGTFGNIFANPLASLAEHVPARLEPATTYRFLITAPVKTASGSCVQYTGVCTTLPAPDPKDDQS